MDESSSKDSRRRLERHHREIETRLKEGHERIIGGYIDDYQVGKNADENEIREDTVERQIEDHHDNHPPHKSIIEKAGLFLEQALDQYEQRHQLDYVPYQFDDENSLMPVYYVHLAIGTEYLLNGIILKNNPQYFKEETDLKKRRSVGFGKILKTGWRVRGELRDVLLADELDKKQRYLIDDTLALIKLHRDNLVHLGYHTMSHPEDTNIFHHVIAYFLAEFTDQEKLAQQFEQHADLEHLDDEDYCPLAIS